MLKSVLGGKIHGSILKDHLACKRKNVPDNEKMLLLRLLQ